MGLHLGAVLFLLLWERKLFSSVMAASCGRAGEVMTLGNEPFNLQ